MLGLLMVAAVSLVTVGLAGLIVWLMLPWLVGDVR